MDFSALELSEEDAAFLDRARQFRSANATEELLRREHQTGDVVHRGTAPRDGRRGVARAGDEERQRWGIQRGSNARIWDLERRRAKRSARDAGAARS